MAKRSSAFGALIRLFRTRRIWRSLFAISHCRSFDCDFATCIKCHECMLIYDNPLWQLPLIGQSPHPQPQELLPFFLFFTIYLTMPATTAISSAAITMVAIFPSIHDNIWTILSCVGQTPKGLRPISLFQDMSTKLLSFINCHLKLS